jgi:prepilin signal peptidase PulO-like enzyme (type II secretory pathway)
MIGPVYYGSLIAVSIAAPILASCLRRISWRYKLPFCVLLANVLPLVAIAPSFPSPRAAGGMGMAMMFGLIISLIIVPFLSMYLKDRVNQ